MILTAKCLPASVFDSASRTWENAPLQVNEIKRHDSNQLILVFWIRRFVMRFLQSIGTTIQDAYDANILSDRMNYSADKELLSLLPLPWVILFSITNTNTKWEKPKRKRKKSGTRFLHRSTLVDYPYQSIPIWNDDAQPFSFSFWDSLSAIRAESENRKTKFPTNVDGAVF